MRERVLFSLFSFFLIVLLFQPGALAAEKLSGELTYISLQGDIPSICMADLNTQSQRPLLTAENSNIRFESITWSPNGEKFIYRKIISISLLKADYELWLSNKDGTEQVKLSARLAYSSTTSWSPDGEKVLFVQRDADKERIYVYNVITDDLKAIDIGEAEVEPDVSWSPDGRKILGVLKEKRRYGVFHVDIETQEVTILTENRGFHSQARWSPDGEKIVFVYRKPLTSMFGDKSGIYIMDTNGDNLRNLIEGENYTDLAWCPDSSFISYTKAEYSQADKKYYYGRFIYKIGKKSRPIMIEGGEKKFEDSSILVWSPDGEKLAFRECFSVYVIFSGEKKPVKLRIPYAHGVPVWSPDSSLIACAGYPSLLTNKSNIYVAPVDGSIIIKLTEDETHEYSPVWVPVTGNEVLDYPDEVLYYPDEVLDYPDEILNHQDEVLDSPAGL